MMGAASSTYSFGYEMAGGSSAEGEATGSGEGSGTGLEARDRVMTTWTGREEGRDEDW